MQVRVLAFMKCLPMCVSENRDAVWDANHLFDLLLSIETFLSFESVELWDGHRRTQCTQAARARCSGAVFCHEVPVPHLLGTWYHVLEGGNWRVWMAASGKFPFKHVSGALDTSQAVC